MAQLVLWPTLQKVVVMDDSSIVNFAEGKYIIIHNWAHHFSTKGYPAVISYHSLISDTLFSGPLHLTRRVSLFRSL